MNKLQILITLIVMLTVLAACGKVRTESTSETATTGKQQKSGLAQDTSAGEVPLHPDVVHGLVRRPASTETTVVRQEQGPLHPDVVHGLVSLPAESELTRAQSVRDAEIKAGPLAEGKSPLHPDVVHGLVRPPYPSNLVVGQSSAGD